MRKVLMSACLLGKKVRYDGGALAVADQIVERWRSEGRIISVCPEVEAGMSIPRPPAEIFQGSGESVLNGGVDVIEKDGGKVTNEFLAGASIALNLCHKFAINVAVLAEFSPSCGSSAIYDGSFAGKKIPGMGVTAALLREHGVQVFSQYEIAEADTELRTKGCDHSVRNSYMQFSIRPAYDKAFAENLIRQNMTVYYQQLDMRWDTALFDKNWNELDCFELVVDDCRVGVLLLNHDENAYYIRELQIVDKWQRQGIGSKAIRYVIEIAKQAGINLIRLRVFCINPAIFLYERMGFRVRKTEGGTHYMECRVS